MSHVRMTDGQSGARKIGARRKARRGLSTVEMALVLTLLLMIVLGIVEYGWMLLKYQQTTGATRQGARIGAPFNRTNTDIKTAIQNSLEIVGLNPANYMVCIGTPDAPCNEAADTVNVENLNPGNLFEVVVTLKYNQEDGVSLGMPLVPRPGVLRSRLTMVREGI